MRRRAAIRKGNAMKKEPSALAALEEAKGHIDGVCRRLCHTAQRLTELRPMLPEGPAQKILDLHVQSILSEVEALGMKT